MHIRGNLKARQFDAKRWLKQFETQMMRLNVLAAGEFLRAVIMRVPVSSGMAMASLLPLARFLNKRHVGVDITIEPIRKPSATRSIELGIASADPAENSFKSNGQGEFLFIFNEHIPHYIFNEFAENGAGPYKNPQLPPPWESFQAGEDAYRTYIRQNAFKSVPRLKEFVYVTKVYHVG